jgi:hypothetical protein
MPGKPVDRTERTTAGMQKAVVQCMQLLPGGIRGRCRISPGSGPADLDPGRPGKKAAGI